MGGASFRAGLLCKSQVIDQLNHYFIPFFTAIELDDAANARALASRPPPASGEEKEARAFLELIRNRFMSKPPVGPPNQSGPKNVPAVQTFILSASGEVENFINPMVPSEEASMPAALQEMIERKRIKGGSAGSEYRSKPYASDSPDGLHMRVVLRYEDPNYVKRLDDFHAARLSFVPDGSAPTRDWIDLDGEQASQLLPPPSTAPGAAYAIPEAIARRMLAVFRPEPSSGEFSNENAMTHVRSHTMSARLCSISDGQGLVRLDASFDMQHPGLRSPYSMKLDVGDNNSVVASLTGYLRYDVATRRIVTAKLITEEAAYCSGDGAKLKFAGVAYTPQAP